MLLVHVAQHATENHHDDVPSCRYEPYDRRNRPLSGGLFLYVGRTDLYVFHFLKRFYNRNALYNCNLLLLFYINVVNCLRTANAHSQQQQNDHADDAERSVADANFFEVYSQLIPKS